jgi:cytochrome c-type biogenesis protein CcmF
VATAAILLGTLYPIAIDAMGGKISVGPPYFNFVFLSITAPLGILIGIGMLIRWRKDTPQNLLSRIKIPAIGVLIVAFLISLTLPQWIWSAFAGLAMSLWIAVTATMAIHERFRDRPLMTTLRATPSGFYGMILGHVGIAVFIVGITLTSLYSAEKDLRMAPGDVYAVAGYDFQFNGVKKEDIQNYVSTRGHFTVTSQTGDFRAELSPEKRIYRVQKSPMTEAAIDAGFTRDLFIALGEPLDDKGSWAIRIYYKPFIRWIWLGAIIMALGGLFAASDRRYRQESMSAEKIAEPTNRAVV